MSSLLKIYYSKVDVLENTQTFDSMLSEIAKIPSDKRIFPGDNFYMENLEYNSSLKLWFGTLDKIRMKNLPSAGNIVKGESKPVNLLDDEGIQETTTFLYDEKLKLILFQKTQYGPSIKQLSEYFAFLINTGPIEFAPILRNDVLDTFNKMDTIYYLEISAAKDDFRTVAAASSSTTDFVSAFNQSQCTKGALTLWADKKAGIPLAKELASMFRKNANKVIVKGSNKEGVEDVLDLIEFKLTVSHDILDDRIISYKDKKDGLRKAYHEQKEYVRTFYP